MAPRVGSAPRQAGGAKADSRRAGRARLDHDRDGEVAHSWGRRLAQGRTFPPWTAPATEGPGFRERGNGHRRNLTALRRTPVSIWNDDVSDWAASLTYYSVLSIFPALLVTVSLVGLTGAATVRDLISNVNAVVPAESRAVIENALKPWRCPWPVP